MIEYRPNRDWLSDVRHLGTSWTLRRLVRAVLAVGLYAAALALIVIQYELEGNRLVSGAFSLLGVILSIVLVFRTNTAYERWWTGREQWGALVNHSRNLAIQVHACFPPEDTLSRVAFARLISNFALALSGHLRGGADRSALLAPPPGQPGDVGSATHVPLALARALSSRINDARRDGTLDPTEVLGMKPHVTAMVEIAGACERIRNTPIPFSYNVFIKIFILAYVGILPLGLIPEYGYIAVPLVMLIAFALLGLELMAEEIEDPFGLDCNDLPTATLAHTIRANVEELLQLPAGSPVAATQEYAKTF